MSEFPEIRSIEFETAFFAADGDWIESLLVMLDSEFDSEAALAPLSRVELFFSERVSSDGDDRQTYRLTVVAHDPYPFLLGMILRERAIPNRLVMSSDRFAGVVTVSEWEDIQRVADEMREQYGRFELQSVNQVETTGAPLGSGQLGRVVRNELSQDQLVVLQTAHEMGYFETPRKLGRRHLVRTRHRAVDTERTDPSRGEPAVRSRFLAQRRLDHSRVRPVITAWQLVHAV